MSYEIDIYDDEKDNFKSFHIKTHSIIYGRLILTARQMDMIALLLTHMKESDWRGPEGEKLYPTYSFDSAQLQDWFGIEPRKLYSALYEPSEKLVSKKISTEINGEWSHRTLLSEIKYGNGVLTITPNPSLEDIFVSNASDSGFAKIINDMFLALPTPHAKRVFEFLCRYRYDTEMYHISVSRLQFLFGIKTEDNKPIKASYMSETTFIARVIKPALILIKKLSLDHQDIEILTSETGDVGYEVVPRTDGNGVKIKFLVRWRNQLSAQELSQAAVLAGNLIEKMKILKKTDGDILPVLVQLEPQLRVLGKELEADRAARKIKEIKAQRKEEAINKSKKMIQRELDKVTALLDDSLFD